MRPHMKEKGIFYIGELSDLFNISVDSIRYYEKIGLISPTRNIENGYREYSPTDVQTLILIREMLGLGLHLEQIKEFVMNRTVQSTINLLEQEIITINEAILKLYEQKNSIQNRLGAVKDCLDINSFEKVQLHNYPKRAGIMITDENLPDDYVDYYMIKYMRETRHKINAIGYCDCYTLDIEGSNPNSDYFRTKNVFFLSTDSLTDNCNFHLPAGHYLSLFYKGSLEQTKQLLPKLYDYAKRHHLKINGDPIEMCRLDTYETTLENEFLTELELPVSID